LVEVTSAPTVDTVAAIAAMHNPVLRNLQITQCYAELSAAMRARTSDAADWCAFATWASRQAGSTIRGEDLIATLDRILGERSWVTAPMAAVARVLLRKGLFQPDTWLGRLTSNIHTPFDAFERASAEVADGNLKVFAEIGREFARFIATVPPDVREDSPDFLAFAAGLRLGPPPGGQDLLREAFAHYQRQRREPDVSARAAWILLANLKIGLHEQTRLQAEIVAAVDAPIATAEALAPHLSWFARRIRKEAVKVTQEAVTRVLMTLSIPLDSHARSGQAAVLTTLALGCDLDAPVPQRLQAAHPFLDALVKRYDPCAAGSTACAAKDWCDLPQRMHYIVHLFRAYADSAALFSAPFTPEQVTSFRAGIIPTGNL
jgi:hypothetical protein